MDNELYRAAAFLPEIYRSHVLQCGLQAEDIRVRAGYPLGVTVCGREVQFPSLPAPDCGCIKQVLETAAHSSLYTVSDTLRLGYINAAFGVRIGVCGTGVNRAGVLTFVKDISSLSIRTARQCAGIADEVLPLSEEYGAESTLIISPPGYGKTSLLRDMVRQLSRKGIRVGVADERGEIAAMNGGQPAFDVGPRTDVIQNVAKRDAAFMLVKTMSPQVLAFDEISAPEDAEAAEYAAGNGAAVLATVHGRNERDILEKPVMRSLMERNVFSRAVIISLENGKRVYKTVLNFGKEKNAV